MTVHARRRPSLYRDERGLGALAIGLIASVVIGAIGAVFMSSSTNTAGRQLSDRLGPSRSPVLGPRAALPPYDPRTYDPRTSPLPRVGTEGTVVMDPATGQRYRLVPVTDDPRVGVVPAVPGTRTPVPGSDTVQTFPVYPREPITVTPLPPLPTTTPDRGTPAPVPAPAPAPPTAVVTVPAPVPTAPITTANNEDTIRRLLDGYGALSTPVEGLLRSYAGRIDAPMVERLRREFENESSDVRQRWTTWVQARNEADQRYLSGNAFTRDVEWMYGYLHRERLQREYQAAVLRAVHNLFGNQMPAPRDRTLWEGIGDWFRGGTPGMSP